jgi:hypothetical protein
MNHGWESSALHKHLVQIKTLLDALEKNPLLHAILLLNPVTAPLVMGNDAMNAYNAYSAGKINTASLPATSGNKTVNVKVDVGGIKSTPLNPDQITKLHQDLITQGIMSGEMEKSANATFDKRVKSDFLSIGI